MSDYDEDYYEDEEYTDKEDNSESSEGDYSSESEGYKSDDIDTGKLNPSDYSRTGGFASEDIGISREGKYGKLVDPITSYLRQIYLILRDKEYTDDIYTKAHAIAKHNIPSNKLLLMNVDVLAPSLIFLAIKGKKGMNSTDIENFLKGYNRINPFDFVRYIRYISNHM